MSLPEIYEFHGNWSSYVEELHKSLMDKAFKGEIG